MTTNYIHVTIIFLTLYIYTAIYALGHTTIRNVGNSKHISLAQGLENKLLYVSHAFYLSNKDTVIHSPNNRFFIYSHEPTLLGQYRIFFVILYQPAPLFLSALKIIIITNGVHYACTNTIKCDMYSRKKIFIKNYIQS